jgi:hypothetical protein
MQRRVSQVEIEHNWFCPIGPLRAAVSEQRQNWIGTIFLSFRKNMKTHLGIGPFILKAFMPGARSKGANSVGARFKLVKYKRFAQVIDCLVGVVVQQNMQVRT